MVESRKTKAELERKIAFVRARVNERKALMDCSGRSPEEVVRSRIAKIEAKALQKVLEQLMEQLHSVDDS